jgi:ATP-dependent DNA helicase RecG
VEEIGTGIYNINKYLPLYSPGRKASFMEDVIFTTTIPIPNLDDLQMRNMKKTTPHDTPQVTKLLKILHGEMSREEILSKLKLKDRENLRKVYLKPALESGFIELTLPGKLRSKKQKYRMTEKGKIFLKSRIKQHE